MQEPEPLHVFEHYDDFGGPEECRPQIRWTSKGEKDFWLSGHSNSNVFYVEGCPLTFSQARKFCSEKVHGADLAVIADRDTHHAAWDLLSRYGADHYHGVEHDAWFGVKKIGNGDVFDDGAFSVVRNAQSLMSCRRTNGP